MNTTLLPILLLASALTSAYVLQKGSAPAPNSPASQRITTALWFEDRAEEAIRFYSSIFKDSKVLAESRWGEGGPLPKGTLLCARFQLAGQEFVVINGNPKIPFTDAISLSVLCQTQAEIDTYWEKLSAGGAPGRCGWLKDKFGVSWQVVPSVLEKLLGDPDPVRAQRVGAALMKMDKLDIAALQKAHDQP
jgi:predicted 3-demethylubiquinone-9 3-methyltransferase (glyoxalase superfamily)